MKQPVEHSTGPPWIGPIMSRRQYEQHWLWLYLVMLCAGAVFFGWRAVVQVALTAGVAMGVFALGALLAVVRSRLSRDAWTSALGMALLTGLTFPLVRAYWPMVAVGVAAGVFCHLMGPAHRLRVHPVALVHVMFVCLVPLFEATIHEAVLTPDRVLIGDVMQRGPMPAPRQWGSLHAPAPFDALDRTDPSRLLLGEQQAMLTDGGRVVTLMEGGHLPRLLDVLIGATAGPIGATSTIVLIVGGVWLMYRRVARWPVALLATAAALTALSFMPLRSTEQWTLSAAQFETIGWPVTIAYISYQLLATPLALIVLVMAPLTMPLSVWGRVIYAVLIGGGAVAARWFVPVEGIAYAPLVVAGTLCPLLDRLRCSRFVNQSTTRRPRPATDASAQ